MITISKWKILIEKNGEPVIQQRNDTYFCNQKMIAKSEEITVTEEGIEYDYTHKGEVTHYKCPYSNLDYKVAPSPLSFRERIDAMNAPSHILCFLYEFFSGVLYSDERYSFIRDREPLDIAALLAKYSEFSDKLSGIDWEKVASQIKLKDKV